MEARILVADDDDIILKFVVRMLENEGYEVVTASDGSKAAKKWEEGLFDLIVLDIKMPGMSGIDVLRRIREDDENIPIVMLTSLDEDHDRQNTNMQQNAINQQNTIKFGADYWVPKTKRTLLRDWINSKLQKLRQVQMEDEDLKINFVAMQVYVKRDNGWEEQHLEAKERELLFFLARREGQVQTYDTLKRRVFKMHRDEEGAGGLTKTVSTLRRKIEPDDPTDPTYIKTVSGAGYRFDALDN